MRSDIILGRLIVLYGSQLTIKSSAQTFYQLKCHNTVTTRRLRYMLSDFDLGLFPVLYESQISFLLVVHSLLTTIP